MYATKPLMQGWVLTVMSSVGDFIRWVYNDVLKEESDTIMANGIEPKKLGGPIALAARRWFIDKLNSEVMASV